ncbi:unnamed protein product [Cuscuta epithymum]|uniref:Uncharacterized protein n=1 Tax=Cuscuta epithymum TaxID=186058 RepID=A0AAV0E4T4_9ASTE|nr:unnamed protein product [Cuscuta epithymum]
MEIKEKAIWTIVAGNVVAAICGIIALIHVPHQVDIGSRVIAAISIVCAVIALIVLGYQAGRRILLPSWVNTLYWVTCGEQSEMVEEWLLVPFPQAFYKWSNIFILRMI